jgi:hypothetical protein
VLALFKTGSSAGSSLIAFSRQQGAGVVSRATKSYLLCKLIRKQKRCTSFGLTTDIAVVLVSNYHKTKTPYHSTAHASPDMTRRTTFRSDGKRIKLPVIGWIKMREAVRFSGPLKCVTVCREGDRWFAAVMVETDDVKPVVQPEPVVGVDLGVTTLATLSVGPPIPGPKSHTAALKRLRRANKALARKRRFPPIGAKPSDG